MKNKNKQKKNLKAAQATTSGRGGRSRVGPEWSLCRWQRAGKQLMGQRQEKSDGFRCLQPMETESVGFRFPNLEWETPQLCVWYQSPTGYGEKEIWARQNAVYLLFFCPAQLACVLGMTAGTHDKNTGLVWGKGNWKWSLWSVGYQVRENRETRWWGCQWHSVAEICMIIGDWKWQVEGGTREDLQAEVLFSSSHGLWVSRKCLLELEKVMK